MKKKRLNRDGWGFQYFPYFQLRIDMKQFYELYKDEEKVSTLVTQLEM